MISDLTCLLFSLAMQDRRAGWDIQRDVVVLAGPAMALAPWPC